jgi:Flp pilus assembly protein TadB
MSDLVLYHVFFGLLVATGVWLLIFGLRPKHPTVPLAPASAEPGVEAEQVTDLPHLARKHLGPPLILLGQRLAGQRDTARLEDRLRRSGWRYSSVGDYYGSKIATAVTFFVGGAIGALLFGLSAPVLIVIAAGLGTWGLFLPDLELRHTIRDRRDALYREMAWTLDRVALVMKTGKAFEPALQRVSGEEVQWLAGGAGGLFMALLRDISKNLAGRRNDVAALLSELRQNLPEDIPELDEFLQAVQLNIVDRQPIVDQMRALSRTMRDRLNNRLDEVAQKAELKVVALTSGVIVPALLVVVLGAAILSFVTTF